MTPVTLTITIDVSQVEAVGRAVNEVISEKDGGAIAAVKGTARLANATGVDPLPSSPSPDLSLIQAKEAAEVTPPASAATNLAGRKSGNPDSALLTAPAIETPAIAARQAGISQTEDQTPEDRAATPSKDGCMNPHDCRIKFNTTALCWKCNAARPKAGAAA